MIYTAPYIHMRAYPLQGQVGGGWALEIESFLGPVKWHRADRRVPFHRAFCRILTMQLLLASTMNLTCSDF
jgi:hypothetical protein